LKAHGASPGGESGGGGVSSHDVSSASPSDVGDVIKPPLFLNNADVFHPVSRNLDACGVVVGVVGGAAQIRLFHAALNLTKSYDHIDVNHIVYGHTTASYVLSVQHKVQSRYSAEMVMALPPKLRVSVFPCDRACDAVDELLRTWDASGAHLLFVGRKPLGKGSTSVLRCPGLQQGGLFGGVGGWQDEKDREQEMGATNCGTGNVASRPITPMMQPDGDIDGAALTYRPVTGNRCKNGTYPADSVVYDVPDGFVAGPRPSQLLALTLTGDEIAQQWSAHDLRWEII
jgi:hypothetical protein